MTGFPSLVDKPRCYARPRRLIFSTSAGVHRQCYPHSYPQCFPPPPPHNIHRKANCSSSPIMDLNPCRVCRLEARPNMDRRANRRITDALSPTASFSHAVSPATQSVLGLLKEADTYDATLPPPTIPAWAFEHLLSLQQLLQDTRGTPTGLAGVSAKI